MQLWKFSTLAIPALLASVSIASADSADKTAIASPGSAMLKLTNINFNKTLEENPLVLLEYFVPWCYHHLILSTQFERAAEDLSESFPSVKLGQVNCVEEEDLCREHEIRGCTTLRISFGAYQQLEEYDGPHDAAGIVDYMVKMSQPPVSVVSDVDSFIQQVNSEFKPFVVQVLPPAAQAASSSFNETFGEIAQQQRRNRDHYSLEDKASIAAFDKLVDADLSGDKAKYLLVHPGQWDDVRVYDADEKTFSVEDFDEWIMEALVPDYHRIHENWRSFDNSKARKAVILLFPKGILQYFYRKPFELTPSELTLVLYFAWYMCITCFCVLALLTTFIMVRSTIFLVTSVVLPQGIWLFPKFFEELSFKPLYAWSGPAGKKAKKNKAGSESVAAETATSAKASGVEKSTGATKRTVTLEEVPE